MTKEDVLKQCRVENNVVKLPNIQLDRKLYLEVKKSLELINGTWKGGKLSGFVFQNDPTELLEQICNGKKRNLKKEYQFFATPETLADELLDYANICESHSILEPSAGQGAIINAINKILPNKIVDCYELNDDNKTFLKVITTANLIGDDFLNPNGSAEKKYDRIIANPPFSKNQDIDHVKEMYNRLENGGRLVSITSKHWKLSKNKKESEFRKWLSELNATEFEIDNGSFKESGTSVGGYILVIDKNE